jgi:hypothetical protein
VVILELAHQTLAICQGYVHDREIIVDTSLRRK